MSAPATHTTLKLLGHEYKIRSDMDPAHLDNVASYVDELLGQVREHTPDSQDAAILVTLNLASELLRLKAGVALPNERVQRLIELVDSA